MLRTPREKFLASYGSKWMGAVREHSIEFEEAIITALLELAQEMPRDCATPQIACDSHQQMIGAHKVLDILCSLHQPPSKPPPIPKGLDYQAGV